MHGVRDQYFVLQEPSPIEVALGETFRPVGFLSRVKGEKISPMCSLPLRFLIVLVSIALLWFGKSALEDGVVRVKGGHLVYKEDAPTGYWLWVGTYFFVGIGGILFAIFGGLIT